MVDEDAQTDSPEDNLPLRNRWGSMGGNLLMNSSGILAILIIAGGVVGMLAFPAIRKAQQTAQRQQAMANLKQIGLAMQHYAQSQPTLPPQEPPQSAPSR